MQEEVVSSLTPWKQWGCSCCREEAAMCVLREEKEKSEWAVSIVTVRDHHLPHHAMERVFPQSMVLESDGNSVRAGSDGMTDPLLPPLASLNIDTSYHTPPFPPDFFHLCMQPFPACAYHLPFPNMPFPACLSLMDDDDNIKISTNDNFHLGPFKWGHLL